MSKMILLNKRMHDEVLTKLGPMQASRVIFLSKRGIYSLIKYCRNEPEFEQEVARLLIKVYCYTDTIMLIQPKKDENWIGNFNDSEI